MKASELVFIGIKGSVVALNRATGELVWKADLKGSQFVNVVADGGMLFATTWGEVFCLDPLTGNRLWHNRLKGFGTDLATIATGDSLRAGLMTVLAEKRQQDEQTAAASAAAS